MISWPLAVGRWQGGSPCDSANCLLPTAYSLGPIPLFTRQLHCGHNRPCFRLRLGHLILGLTVRHDAAAGLHVDAAVLDHGRADVDAGVEVAGVAQVADRAAVGAALDGLELIDDLHRADLG